MSLMSHHIMIEHWARKIGVAFGADISEFDDFMAKDRNTDHLATSSTAFAHIKDAEYIA